jgi:DNA-binding transcriptional LysR family regulator
VPVTTASGRHIFGVELVLTEEFVDLLQHQNDIAIRISLFEDSTLIAKRLPTSSVVCCAAPAYLAEHGTPQDPEALVLHGIIVDTSIRNPANWRFVIGDIVHAQRVQGRLQVNITVLVRNLLLAGAGIALIPEFAVLDALPDRRLVRLPLECEIQDLGIYTVRPQRCHLSNRVRVFVDFLFEWFADGLKRAG